MGTIIDFERAKVHRQMKETTADKGVIYEIFLTVVKYVYEYIPAEYENPVDELNTESNLRELFVNDRNRFAMTFGALVDYWQLKPMNSTDIAMNREFETFQTLGDLCSYIEKSINY